MSQNNWETQPRKPDGEFTYRINFHVWERAEKATLQALKNNPKNVAKFSSGGSYKNLRKETKGNDNLEVHHMPANSISPLSRGEGPCVIMEKEDHKKTESYGPGHKAKRYREIQKALIDSGDFIAAEEIDIKDLLKKFGAKYAKAILEKLEYDKQLETKGAIDD